MNLGQRVKMPDGTLGVIIGFNSSTARVCYLAPNNRLSYITGKYLLRFLTPIAENVRCYTDCDQIH